MCGITWLSPQKDTLINGPDVTCGLGAKANDKPATMPPTTSPKPINQPARQTDNRQQTQDTDNEMELQLLNYVDGGVGAVPLL